MSATTIAVATSTETVDPPLGNWPGHATLPVSDAVMSVPAPLVSSSCSPAPINSSNVNNDLTLAGIWYFNTFNRSDLSRRCENTLAAPQSRHDFVFSEAFGKWGELSRKLNVTSTLAR